MDSSRLSEVWIWIIIGGAVALGIAFGSGFNGTDDLHYLGGALRWLEHSDYIPRDHWEGRLPYILSLAAGIAVLGPTHAALIIPNAVFSAGMLFLCWRIGLLAAGPRLALLSIVMAAATPLFFRFPTNFFPESLEVVLAAGMVYLALMATWNQYAVTTRRLMLIAAGVCGGIAILVRETALAVPVAVSIAMLWEQRSALRRGVTDIAWMAFGTLVPMALECSYFGMVTGDPFYRFKVDTHHVLIASSVMKGNVFTGGSPLFNWKLGPLWNVVGVAHVHWAINPLINVFTLPSLVFLPTLGVVGAILAWRAGGRLRTLAVLALSMLLTQYVINTFVLVIAPNVRYFADAAFVLCFTAAFLLEYARPVYRAAILSVVLAATFVIVAARIVPENVPDSLVRFLNEEPLVYVSQQMADNSYLAALTNPRLANGMRVGAAPVGGAAAISWLGQDKSWLTERCEDGATRWQVVDQGFDVRSIPWILLDRVRLSHLLPSSVGAYLKRDKDAIALVQRTC